MSQCVKTRGHVRPLITAPLTCPDQYIYYTRHIDTIGPFSNYIHLVLYLVQPYFIAHAVLERTIISFFSSVFISDALGIAGPPANVHAF